MSNDPKTTPHRRHLFICVGKYCDPDRKAPGLYRKLAVMLGQLGSYDNPKRVKLRSPMALVIGDRPTAKAVELHKLFSEEV